MNKINVWKYITFLIIFEMILLSGITGISAGNKYVYSIYLAIITIVGMRGSIFIRDMILRYLENRKNK